jgi:PAS domain S-box-containing protein
VTPLFRFMNWPLRAKMAALFVVASLLPLGGATWTDIREARERLVANAADLLAARGDHLAGQIDAFHRVYQVSVARFARLPLILQYCRASPGESERLKPTLGGVFDAYPGTDPSVRGVLILDLAGTVKVATDEQLLGANLSRYSYVREALQGGTVISDVHLAESPRGDEPTIAYLAPVLGLDGKPVAIAVLWMRASAVWALMKQGNELAGAGSFAVLFDRWGIRIGHTYSDEIVFHPGGRLAPATRDALVAERRFGVKTRQLLEDVRPFPEQFARAIATSPGREIFRGIAPVNQKWNYVVARRLETVPWTIFYVLPEQSLNPPIAQMIRHKTVFAGAIMILALAAGTLFATVILRPIGSLSRATNLIAGGDLAARVQPAGGDELGRLGTSFNSMAGQIETQATALQHARDELELRVQARTAELRQKSQDLEVQIAERERLAAITESSDDAIISKDLDGVITIWNLAAERMFGYPGQEMVGTPMTLIIPPDRGDEEPRILAQILRGETVDHFETMRIRKDGKAIEVSVTVSPIKDRDGRIIGASNIARDITARKQAEAEVRESEARYRTLFDTLIEGFCTIEMIFDADGKAVDYRFLEINPAFEKQTGLHNAQGRLMRDLAPDHEARWFEIYGKIALTGEPAQFESDAKALGRHFDVSAYRVGGPESRRVAILFNDITERKRAEHAIRQSEERFHFLNDLTEATRTLADPAQIMTVMARMLGEHLRASRCAYADVEKDGEQFTILHDYTDGCASTVGNYGLSLFGARAVATLHRGETLIIRNVEAELVPDDGADMFNAIGIKAIITCPLVKDGGLRAMMAVHQTTPRDWQAEEIAIVQDVVERCWATIERRTAEETIHQLNVELEQRVIERTAQLETANQELEAFSYSVSHDLRAPLRSIDGFSRILMKDFAGKLDDDGQDSFRRIRAATQRMGQLIDDLLELSRVTRAELRRERVDLSALARAVVEDLRRHEPGRSAEVVVAEGVVAVGDPHLLRAVMENLLGNAWKFTSKCAHARIEFGAVQQEGQTTYFVRDDGAGFDPTYAEKLFGTFQRLHSTTDFPGTGVGLATVQRIVRRHGGRVWADGNVNQGAIFHFNLGAQA